MNGNIDGMKNGNASQVPLPLSLTDTAPATMTQQAPAAVMEEDGAAGSTAGIGTEATNSNVTGTDGGSNELNFTNMTFAPPNEEAPMSINPQDQPFDMSNFATTDGNNDMMSLDNNNFISDSNAQGTATVDNNGGQAQDTTGAANAGDNGGGSLDDFDWSLGNEGGGDGLDFDFSIGGEDTFNTLMNERDGEFDSMDQGGFDNDPFNMGKPDGT
jgi:hypothetical protein